VWLEDIFKHDRKLSGALFQNPVDQVESSGRNKLLKVSGKFFLHDKPAKKKGAW